MFKLREEQISELSLKAEDTQQLALKNRYELGMKLSALEDRTKGMLHEQDTQVQSCKGQIRVFE